MAIRISGALYYLAISPSLRSISAFTSIISSRRVSGMAMMSNQFIPQEKSFTCSDGVVLASRCWTNFDGSDGKLSVLDVSHASTFFTRSSFSSSQRQHITPPSSSRLIYTTSLAIPTNKIICLHGWLDNAASFNRLAPLLLAAHNSPTEIVALDFPGHGLSSHKSVDGPPQLLAEYTYYVSECLEALGWVGGGSTGGGGGTSALSNIKANISTDGNSVNNGSSGDTNSSKQEQEGATNENKVTVIGHSMGAGDSMFNAMFDVLPSAFSLSLNHLFFSMAINQRSLRRTCSSLSRMVLFPHLTRRRWSSRTKCQRLC